jgi:hypothetical protein
LDRESAIVAETRSRKRTEARRSATDVAPTTAEVRMATEMSTTMATEMPPTTMAAATVTTSSMAAAAFRNGITRGRQYGHQNNGGDPNIEFRHGTLTRRCVMNSRHRGTNEERKPDDMVPLWQQKRRRREGTEVEAPGPFCDCQLTETKNRSDRYFHRNEE